MKRKIIIMISIFLLIQCIKYSFIKQYEQDYGNGRAEILPQTLSLTYNELEHLEGYEALLPTPVSIINCQMTYKQSFNVQAIATDYTFLEKEPIKLKQGAFLQYDATLNRRNVVVISDQLATQLYGSQFAVGNICKINESYYQVIGVYTKIHSLWDKKFDDGQENIYIPFNSSVAKDLPIKHFIIQQEKTINLSVLPFNRYNSRINDHLQGTKVLKSFNEFPVSVVMLLVIIEIIKFNLDKLKQIKNYYYKVYKKYYFKDLISCHLKEIGKLLLVWGVSIASIGILYKLGFSKLYVLPEALPNDNLFDLAFYLQYLYDKNQIYNYFAKYGVTYFAKRHHEVAKLLVILGSIQVIISYIIHHYLVSDQ